MTLTRTKSGLQNIHKLKGVDLIIYTEGGDNETLTKDQILEGAGHEKSIDIRFWSKLFSQFYHGAKVKFLAVGGCLPLQQIAQEIADGNLNNVCVAMDRDYSNFWGTTVQHRRVIYTRTYSWENELYNTDVILRAFEQIALDNFEAHEIRSTIENARNSLLGQFKHFLRADMILVAADRSLFCRDKPASCLNHVKANRSLPEVNRLRLRSLIQSEKSNIRGFQVINRPNSADLDVARDIFGKPLLAAAVRTLQYLVQNANQKSVPNDYLENFLLNAFFTWIAENPASTQAGDYRGKISNLNAVA